MKDDLPPTRLDQLFAHWSQVRRGLIETIDAFNPEDLSYVPFPSSWSAGEIMLHIANAESGWFQYVVARQLKEWPEDYSLESWPTPESIKTLLAEVHARTDGYLASFSMADLNRNVTLPWNGNTLTLGWIIWHIIEHEIHHRGELSMILGLLGRKGLDV